MKIKTEFGTAVIDNGCYRIKSNEKGYRGKLLHRLKLKPILDYLEYKYPEINWVVHHKDGNRLNNEFINLQIMTHNQHSIFHNKKRLMTDKLRENIGMGISKKTNTSGYYRVTKRIDKTCKQGFIWQYEWKESGKRKILSSVNIEKLKEKVKDENLKWVEI